MPEAAAGHNTLVLRRRTLLTSMAHECTDRTSRRAEIPPPERGRRRFATLHKGGAAAFGGRPPLSPMWWRNLSPPARPACPVRALMRHAG